MDKFGTTVILLVATVFAVATAIVTSDRLQIKSAPAHISRGRPEKQVMFCNDIQPKATAHGGEPSFFVKQTRRISVFRMAFQIYAEYQFAKRKAKRMQHRLGISDDEAEDNAEIVNFWSEVNQKNAVRLTNQIKKLQGFWTKVGQYMSSRADVMPREYLTELGVLQDGMPPRMFDDIMQTLKEDFTADQMKMIDHIDPNPLSTASLAQVHRARLVDGQEVVIKVQHRGVATLMRQDIENLRVILKIISRFEPDFDFEPVVKEYSKEVAKELDFRTEAINMNEVRQMLQDNNIRAIVPKSLPDLITERVLVMDFCHGFAVRDLEQMDQYSVNRDLLLERICAAWAVQMHVGGVFNADPHYGNILVSTDSGDDASVPVLLDFGLTKRLDPNMKIAFSRLMHASDEGDVDAMLQSFDEMGLKLNRYDPFEDMAAMQRSYSATVPQAKAKEIQKRKSKDYQARIAALKEEEGLDKKQKLRNPVEAWPSELVFFGRVSNLLRGLCSYLDVEYPYLNTMANAARVTLRDTVPLQDRATTLLHHESSVEESNLQGRLEEAIKSLQTDGQMMGLQLSVRSQGREIVNIAAGVLGSANPRPVTASTLFNIFSTGKSVLAIGVLRLVQDGRVELDAPVSRYWPEFGKDEITVRHILSHQSGLANALPATATLDTMLDWPGMKQYMEEAKPEHKAGADTRYHYLSFAWLCGGLIEAVTNEPYENFLDEILQNANGSDGRNPIDLYTGGLVEAVESHELAVISLLKGEASAQAEEESAKERAKQMEAAAKARQEEEEKSDTSEEAENHKKVLAKYRGREQLMNPSVFNMRKVRNAKLPSANMHASASALTKVLDDITMQSQKSPAISSETLAMAQKRQDQTRHNGQELVGDASTSRNLLLDDSSAYFGLGFQVHEFYSKKSQSAMLSYGHAGLGGSIVLSIPDTQFTIALTTNQLARESMARNVLLKLIFDEFDLQAPKSLLQ